MEQIAFISLLVAIATFILMDPQRHRKLRIALGCLFVVLVIGVFIIDRSSKMVETSLEPTSQPMPFIQAPTETIPTPRPTPIIQVPTEIVPTPMIKSVWIDSSQGWHDTGIGINSGDSLEIAYTSGQWTTSEEYWVYTDADGSVNEEVDMRSDAQYYKGDPDYFKIIRNALHQALIGRIGNGSPFLVGNSKHTLANQSGVLFLRVNDIDESLYDNEGSIQVKITVSQN